MHTPPIEFPKQGKSREEVLKILTAFGTRDPDYRHARTWSLVYYLGEEHTRLLEEASSLYLSANGLNPMAFKSLKRFEQEVVALTAQLLHGDETVCGTMTSGGTESCLLAVKTYRDWARVHKPWIKKPQMIIPQTGHVAWEKGGDYFGVQVIHAPLDQELRGDVAAVRSAITKNTILILGSAPEYPHGIIDPIAELGEIAAHHHIPLHVDACLGGYLLPFVAKLGYPLPPFDFSVPGVTSMSADTHKYGYSAKGASVILYRHPQYLKHQFFVSENWPGGVFASPGLLGTRPGGSIAAAWATIQALGEDGYLAHAKTIMATTHQLLAGIAAIPELYVMGKPQMSVFAYGSQSPQLDIFAVADQLESRGWHIDRLQRPAGIHAMVTPFHEKIVDQYLSDLRDSVAHVRAHPELALAGGAATYGMLAHIPLRGLVKENVLKMVVNSYGPKCEELDAAKSAQQTDLATRLGMLFLKCKQFWQKWWKK